MTSTTSFRARMAQASCAFLGTLAALSIGCGGGGGSGTGNDGATGNGGAVAAGGTTVVVGAGGVIGVDGVTGAGGAPADVAVDRPIVTSGGGAGGLGGLTGVGGVTTPGGTTGTGGVVDAGGVIADAPVDRPLASVDADVVLDAALDLPIGDGAADPYDAGMRAGSCDDVMDWSKAITDGSTTGTGACATISVDSVLKQIRTELPALADVVPWTPIDGAVYPCPAGDIMCPCFLSADVAGCSADVKVVRYRDGFRIFMLKFSHYTQTSYHLQEYWYFETDDNCHADWVGHYLEDYTGNWPRCEGMSLWGAPIRSLWGMPGAIMDCRQNQWATISCSPLDTGQDGYADGGGQDGSTAF